MKSKPGGRQRFVRKHRSKAEKVPDDGSIVLDLPLTWRNILALIGVRPESMSRVFRKLDEEGWARYSGRTVYVRDFDGLMCEIGPDRGV